LRDETDCLGVAQNRTAPHLRLPGCQANLGGGSRAGAQSAAALAADLLIAATSYASDPAFYIRNSPYFRVVDTLVSFVSVQPSKDSSVLGDLHDHLYLDRNPHWKRAHPDRRPCMFPALAEYFL
jgi:hypothetical protein